MQERRGSMHSRNQGGELSTDARIELVHGLLDISPLGIPHKVEQILGRGAKLPMNLELLYGSDITQVEVGKPSFELLLKNILVAYKRISKGEKRLLHLNAYGEDLQYPGFPKLIQLVSQFRKADTMRIGIEINETPFRITDTYLRNLAHLRKLGFHLGPDDYVFDDSNMSGSIFHSGRPYFSFVKFDHTMMPELKDRMRFKPGILDRFRGMRLIAEGASSPKDFDGLPLRIGYLQVYNDNKGGEEV